MQTDTLASVLQDIPIVQPNIDIADAHLRILAKLLGDVNRLRIFALLRQGEQCVCNIEAATELSQNLVSHHLRVLRESGLVQSRKSGRWMYYSINRVNLALISAYIQPLFDPQLVSDSPANCSGDGPNS